MSEQVMDLDEFHKFIVKNFNTTKILVRRHNQILTVEPIYADNFDRANGLLGILSGQPELTVDKFMERKQSEKELDFEA
ncbi:MAG: hypothetical protein LBS60_14525 [Deltaproteobacteria bacterium]|jgi:hypothetical protein|nr:hypothetical protein [Deltaproteobacteria bacterium]